MITKSHGANTGRWESLLLQGVLQGLTVPRHAQPRHAHPTELKSSREGFPCKPLPYTSLFPAKSHSTAPWLQWDHCSAKQHIGKALRTKVGTSELPVLDAGLQAWPDTVPFPTPLHWATASNSNKLVWSELLLLLRKAPAPRDTGLAAPRCHLPVGLQSK